MLIRALALALALVAAPGLASATAPPTATSAVLRGKLQERVDAPPYSYLRFRTATGEVWAAVPQNTLAPGADVAIEQPMLMRDFVSKTLKRTFAEVYFGTLVGAPAAAPPATATAAAPAALAMQKLEKARGKEGRSIAEVYAQKSALADRRVVVRGQVTKYNGGILGRNWLHLRDGSGDPARKDDDLTVTTNDTAKVGDIVVVTGTVRLGKDFGAGYAYPVLVEEATLAPK